MNISLRPNSFANVSNVTPEHCQTDSISLSERSGINSNELTFASFGLVKLMQNGRELAEWLGIRRYLGSGVRSDRLACICPGDQPNSW
jgi:hypothetical protein